MSPLVIEGGLPHFNQLAQQYAQRFANIGATFQPVTIDGKLTLQEPSTGRAVSDGQIQWSIPLDDDCENRLLSAFSSMFAIADALGNMDDNRIWGIWLDKLNRQYLIESGRIFPPDELEAAIAYAIQFNQREIFDLDLGKSIPMIPQIIDGHGEHDIYAIQIDAV